MSNHTKENEDAIHSNSLLIFSLLDHRYDPNMIFKIYDDLGEGLIPYDKLREVFDERAVNIVKETQFRDLPTKVLEFTNLSNLITERIAYEYPKLADLVHNLESFSKSKNYLPQTKQVVIDFLKRKLKISKVSEVEQDLNTKIYSLIEKHEPITRRSILIKMKNNQTNLTEEKLYQVLEYLTESKKIHLKASGYCIRYATLKSMLNTLDNDEYDFVNELINECLKGEYINKRDVKKFRQYVANFPVIYNESMYKRIMDKYNVSLRLLRHYKQNDMMMGYTLLKYDFQPMYDTKDFIRDWKLWKTYSGQEAIKKASLAYVNGTVIKRTQSDTLKNYTQNSKIRRFHTKQIKDFKDFIESNNLDDLFDPSNYETFYKQLANIDSLSVVDDYLYFVDVEVDDGLHKIITNYFEGLSHIVSCKAVYSQASETIDKSSIKNYRELYALIKFHYKRKFSSKIKFKDKWFTVEPFSNDFSQYAYEELLKNNCIKKKLFITHLSKATMIRKSWIEDMISSFISRYSIGDYLEIPTDRLFTESEISHYKTIIGEFFIDKSNLFDKVKDKFNDMVAYRLMNAEHLKLLDYNIDAYTVFNNKFENFNEAFIAWLKSKGKRIDESEIERRISISSSRFYKFIRSNHLVKVSEFTYYNTSKFFDVERVNAIRDDVLNLFEEGEIFGLNEIVKHPKYLNEIRKAYPDIDFNFLEETFLKEIIRHAPNLYSFKGHGVAFRKGKKLMKSDMVYAEVIKTEKLNMIDLEGILIRKYKIRSLDESFINEAKTKYKIYKDPQGNLYKDKKTHNILMEGYLKYGRTKRS